MNSDVYIYERKFFNDVVLVAINKNDSSGYAISGLYTALPSGTYSDYLSGFLGGSSLTVSTGGGGNNPANNFTLPAHTVAVWQSVRTTAAARDRLLGPTPWHPGMKVTIVGEGV